MRKLFYFLISVLIFVFITYFSFIDYESYNEQSVDFSIERPYLTVVKALSTKESLEKTIEDSNGKLKYKHWHFFTIEIPQRLLRLKEYKLEGKMDFLVEKNDDSLGKLKLPFEQNISIDKNMFCIKTTLKSAQGRLLLCDKVVEITPVTETSTNVKINSEIKVKRFIPFFFKNYMNKKVEEFNKEDLENLTNNFLNATQDFRSVIKFKRKN